MIIIKISVFLIVWSIVIAYHIITYFGSQFIEGSPHTVGWAIDNHIPFYPGFIYVYCSWFILLFIVPFVLNKFDTTSCYQYFIANIFDLTISTIVFLLFPTTFQRPTLSGKGLTYFFMRKVYGANHRFLNCAPSVHCSISFLFIIVMLRSTIIPPIIRIPVILLSFGIVISTMLVKQHVLLDVLTAIPVALISWLLSGLINITKIALIIQNF